MFKADGGAAAGGARRRLFWLALVCLVAVWVVGIFFRMELRAHWWAYRLTHVPAAERQYYLVRLASIGDQSLGALDRLWDDPRAEVRGMGIRVLHYCKSPAATELLMTALADADAEVAGMAALELALRPDGHALVPRLVAAVKTGPPLAAWGACAALERMGGPVVEQALLTALPKVSDANVRAQIIDSLGMLGSKAAVPALTAMLADNRPIERLPASQGSAARALGALQGQLAAKGVDVKTLADVTQAERTVASVAARALALISTSGKLLDVLDGDKKEHADDQDQADDLGGDLDL